MYYRDREVEQMWENLIEHSIATGEELDLVTSINGYNMEALNDVLYVRTGYRDWDQYMGYDDE